MAVDAAPGHPDFGKAVRCPACSNYVRTCNIAPDQWSLTLEGLSGGGTIRTLRAYGYAVLKRPSGFATVWGEFGTGKTHWLQALVLKLCRDGTEARYYHANDIQRMILDDVEKDTGYGMLLRRIPVLAIDELDKYHWRGRTDFLKAHMQALIDFRYQQMGRQLTVFALNREPVDPVVPGDVASRLHDSRFKRPWPEEEMGWPDPGLRELPPVLALAGLSDMRPMLVPDP